MTMTCAGCKRWSGRAKASATGLLGEALAVARRDPPRVVKGDLRHDLPALAAEAPRDATLVVFHTAVLAYVREAADRDAFAETREADWARNG